MFARVSVPAPLTPLGITLDYRIPEDLMDQVQVGSWVTVPLGTRKVWGLVFEIVGHADFDPKRIKPIQSIRLPLRVANHQKLQWLRWLSQHYYFPLGEVCESLFPASIREASQKILEKYWLELDDKNSQAQTKPSPHTLNADQQRAVNSVLESGNGVHLLFGVTGSGKTEVYLNLIDRVLQQGQSAIVLVPEISLTPQLTARFEERFGEQVAVFHSAQKPLQIRREWLAVLRGKKSIVVGARSALFAPIQNLGMIVVDEEHDGSYKQEESLRYHARDAACELGRLLEIPVVLGSATPSAEAYATCRAAHGHFIHRLHLRAHKEATMPSVELVDLKDAFLKETKEVLPEEKRLESPEDAQSFGAKTRADFFLSPLLLQKIQICLEKKQQSILFLNRRGTGSQILCSKCGHTPECPSCDVSLTPHFKSLLCHYCSYEIPTPDVCAKCATENHPYTTVGIGTEAVEQALCFHFPKASISRLDRDTASDPTELQNILNDFREHKSDILIGTQMVAKGHDFPKVSLVGILMADLGLHIPDFRSHENTLQLLLQVSGRSGRGGTQGEVVLQCFDTTHPIFLELKAHKGLEDYEKFLEMELQRRQALHYPPFGNLVLLRFDGLEKRAVVDASESVGRALKRTFADGLQVLGPVDSPLTRVRNRHRRQILLKGTNPVSLEKTLDWILGTWHEKKLEKKFGARLILDVDPHSML